MDLVTNCLFSGCGTALITPMRRGEGADDVPVVDYEAFARLVRAQIEGGVDALIVCGTTGESPTLTDGEKKALFCLMKTERSMKSEPSSAKQSTPSEQGTPWLPALSRGTDRRRIMTML